MTVHGIYWMMLLTLAVSAGVWGGVFFITARSRRRLLWLLLPGLPLSAVVNLVVKGPLARELAQQLSVAPILNRSSPWFWIAFVAMLAPVTEELVKVLPLIIPAVRRVVLQTPYSALWGGFALGMSFGLGEVIFLSYGIARSPSFSGMPWYVFTGFLGERFIVVLLHGILTSLVVSGLQRGRLAAAAGAITAVVGHLLVNAGAIGIALGWMGNASAQAGLLAMTLILVAIFFKRSSSIAPLDVIAQDADEVILYREGDIPN